MASVDGVWFGSFDAYSEAELSISIDHVSPPSLFAERAWLDRQASLVHQVAPVGRTTQRPPRPTNLPFAAALVGARVIVDFGGGSGWVREFLNVVPSDQVRYVVIEVDSVVDRFAGLASPQIDFVTVNDPVIDQLAGQTDILYSNSALQYLPDNSALCAVVDRVRPSWVLLDEVLWSSTGRDWFTVQMNSVIPAVARFASIDRLVADLASRGYHMTWKDRFGSHDNYSFPAMDHLPTEVRIPHALALAFTEVHEKTLD